MDHVTIWFLNPWMSSRSSFSVVAGGDTVFDNLGSTDSEYVGLLESPVSEKP